MPGRLRLFVAGDLASNHCAPRSARLTVLCTSPDCLLTACLHVLTDALYASAALGAAQPLPGRHADESDGAPAAAHVGQATRASGAHVSCAIRSLCNVPV